MKYSYNALGQLINVIKKGDTQTKFNYLLDKLCRRIKETVAIKTTTK